MELLVQSTLIFKARICIAARIVEADAVRGARAAHLAALRELGRAHAREVEAASP